MAIVRTSTEWFSSRRLAVWWAILIAVLLLAPGSAVPTVPWWVPASIGGWADCLVHGALFLVEALLVLRGTGGARTGALRQGRWVLMLLAYALLLELLQLQVPGRSFQWMDIVSAALGIGIAVFWLRRRGTGMYSPTSG